MSLSKHNYQVLLGRGIDQKTDDKQLDVGKLLVLENATFQKIGKVKKRFGYDLLSNNILGGGILGSTDALLTNDDELLRIADNSLYSFMPSGYWINKGNISQVGVNTESIARGNVNLTQSSSAHLNGISVYTWYDGTNVISTVIDQTTGQVVLGNYTIAVGSRPLLVTNDNFIYVYYFRLSTNSLHCRRLSPLVPQTFDAEVTLTTQIGNDGYYDITQYGSNSLSLVYKDTSDYLVLAYCKINGDIATPLDGYPAPITYTTETADNAVAVQVYNVGGLNDGIYAFYHNNTSGLNYFFIDEHFINTPTAVVVDPTTTIVRNIVSYILSSTAVQVFYELDATYVYDLLIYKNTVDTISGVGTPSVFLRSVSLCSKPFVDNGIYYLVTGHDGEAGYLQATYFLVDYLGRVVNKFNALNGGSANNVISHTQHIDAISTTEYLFSGLIKTQLLTEDNVLYGILGVSGHIFDFSTVDLYDFERLGQNLHIAGGLIYVYDGVNIVEAGFNLFPDNLTETVDDMTGYLEAGQRSALFVYEWTDNKGQIHRSAPSVPIIYTTSGGASNVDFTVSTLRLTQKQGSAGEVRIVGYSTVVNGTTYYRMTSVTSPLLNDTTVDLVTFNWGTNSGEDDANIINNEILYTTGGILENIQPPSSTIIETYGNRLVLAGCEDEAEVWYSKEYVKGEAVAFNDSFVIRADKDVGKIKGLAVIDDKLIIFKESSIYAVAGQGPVDTGASNDFQTPVMVTIDTGCTENKSLVRTPVGVMFKSSKGIYMLGRDLNCTYIGAEVEAYNSARVVDSELMKDTTQVRFLLDNGKCIVYDYYFQQWGTFTNFQDAVSGVIWQGAFTWSKSIGEVYKENNSLYLDNGQFFPMRLVTPWIKVNGVQGFQRIYSGILIGSYKSAHVLRLRVYYNYEDFYRDTVFIDTATVINPTYYGGPSPYGIGSPYGAGIGGSGIDTLYQFQFKQSIQKCDAIKFEIEDVDKYSTQSDTFDISSMCLEVGIKSGYMRVSEDKRFRKTI